MNFNLIFSLVSTLSFTLDWELSGDEQQDFFIFNGLNSSAHLFLRNNSLSLYIQYKNSFSTLNYQNPPRIFTFSWPEYSINGENMSVIKYESNTTKATFSEFTFLSPIVNVPVYTLESVTEPTYLMKINYGYIALIALAIGLVLKSSIVSSSFYFRILEIIKKKEEDDYVTMSQL